MTDVKKECYRGNNYQVKPDKKIIREAQVEVKGKIKIPFIRAIVWLRNFFFHNYPHEIELPVKEDTFG